MIDDIFCDVSMNEHHSARKSILIELENKSKIQWEKIIQFFIKFKE